MKVEVFKTNVADPELAKRLVAQVERNFTPCKVNFDLDDCSRWLSGRILRVVGEDSVQSDLLLDLLKKDAGCIAEVLPDNKPFKSSI